MLKKRHCASTAVSPLLAVVAVLGQAAHAQTGTAYAPSSNEVVNATGASPWYVGASQGISRSSNVYRTPNGKSDVYSSTSLLGGLDTSFGRQRVYANGSVSLNRYRDEGALDNTSYSLNAGADFETVMRLSGGINVGLDQQLASPTASTAEAPQERRNLARTERVDGRLLWGGASTITVELRGGYSRVGYADLAYAGSESSSRSVGLTGYYRPGARLRVGLGLRADRTHQPVALLDPLTGATQANDIDGRHVDLIADYALSAITSLGARLSYTRQSNSSPFLAADDFSGLTGAFNASYRATGKLSANLSLSRDVGTASSGRVVYTVALPTSTGPSPSTSPTVTAGIIGLENNRVTNAASFGLSYAATSRIAVNAGIQYVRSTVASTSTLSAGADVTDSATVIALGASYSVTRLISLGCSGGYERRDVTGGTDFSYSVNTVGCTGTVRWP